MDMLEQNGKTTVQAGNRSYTVIVTAPEKNAAREDSDRIRLGKMLDQLIRIPGGKRKRK
ncbi:hypothetical protein [uncultured Ruminococcus sp.]|uniref:hypothetical protein n=1 Tax=uncultured Ruminococcus sp. TaxID=165186 RepID=UPI0026076322|nr:hypothetical protein [uncultured Ruminococcus sp.]